MALFADNNGVVQGKFTIPEGVPAGRKSVHFEGSGGSFGDAVFTGQGTLITETMQEVIEQTTTTVQRVGTDPLAQTFSLTRRGMLGAVDLFVVTLGTTPIIVQIRDTMVGIPTSTVLAEARLKPSEITVDRWNRWIFPQLLTLNPDQEYSIVVLCDDADSEVAIAEMGAWDTENNRWVTSQPFQIGTLLSSSNASTWTPHQDRDLSFRLQFARFTESERVVNLGNVAVTNATDLLASLLTISPANGATSSIELDLPDGRRVTADDGQLIGLEGLTSGNIPVRARLRATPDLSAQIYPGSQIIQGRVATTATYISRAVQMDAAGSNVRVVFSAFVPSGASMGVSISNNGTEWQSINMDGNPMAIGDGVFEYQYYAQNLTWPMVRVRIQMTGTVTVRPIVGRLRVSVT